MAGQPTKNRSDNFRMKNWPHALAQLLTTLWVGGLWSIGFLAAPILFATLPDKMLAGMLAGNMFTLIAYTGMICACYLLLYYGQSLKKQALQQTAFRIIVLMLLLTLIGQFGIQPQMAELKAQALPADVMHSAFAERFQMLHHIATLLYSTQSLLGIVLVLKTRRC